MFLPQDRPIYIRIDEELQVPELDKILVNREVIT